MALGGSNKTLVIKTKFDADASTYLREVERVNAKTKEAQAISEGFGRVLGEIKLEKIKQAFGALGAELGGTAQAMANLASRGIAMGAVFGPLGAWIGGVTGALVGLVRQTDRQSEASLRAAEAARKHAEALRLVAEGETKGRQARRSTREALELAEEELAQELAAATRAGLGPDAPNVERARRALREAQAEREALNRADGVIWLEQRKRELERINLIKDNEAAVRSGILTQEEANRRLNEFNRAQSDSLDIIGRYRQRQQETAEAVAKLNKALQEGRINAKEYTELLRATDEDYRRRDDERKRREQEAIQRARQLREEREKLLEQEARRQAQLASYARIRSVNEFLGVFDLGRGEIEAAERQARERQESELALQALEGQADRFAAQERIRANERLLLQHNEMAEAIQREIELMREYTSLVGDAYGAIVDGSSGAAAALAGVARQHLIALGTREAVEAASQFAYGLGALANPLFAGAASLHFASAAKHAAAAALAGVGVAALGSISGGGASASSSGASGAGSGGGFGGGGRGSGGDGQMVTNYIIIGDSFAEEGPLMRQRHAERIVELGTQRTSAGRAE